MQRHFFSTLHPITPVISATATVVAIVLLRNSRFNFHCYTQHEATPTQKSARKWRCDLSWLLAWKITKGIHSCNHLHWTAQYYCYRLLTNQACGKFSMSVRGIWPLCQCHIIYLMKHEIDWLLLWKSIICLPVHQWLGQLWFLSVDF